MKARSIISAISASSAMFRDWILKSFAVCSLAHAGAVFDGNALDKTTDSSRDRAGETRLSLRPGSRPHLSSDAAARRIDISFVIDQGPRTYVERIEIHGNTRTRDYVIRREFDIAEGDAYNKTLIDRAERRLQEPELFQDSQDFEQAGFGRRIASCSTSRSTEQSTGDFTISGGYSTTDGVLAEVKLGDRNFLGSGKAVNTSVTYGQYARGLDLSASEPYFLGTRVSAGIDLYYRQSDATLLPVLWQQHLWRDAAVRHADHRATRRAVSLLHL